MLYASNFKESHNNNNNHNENNKNDDGNRGWQYKLATVAFCKYLFHKTIIDVLK